MIRNKNLALAALTLAFVGGTVSQSMAQSVQVAFSPNKPRYARGEQISVVVLVRDWWGNRCPNAPVWLIEDVRSRGLRNFGGFYWTNGAGEIRVPYRVPTNTSWDNIHFEGWTLLSNGWFVDIERLPIGR